MTPDRNPREPAPRRHRRRRPVRLLRRRAHPQRRGDARPGRPLRPPPHPLRPGPRRRRPRPPEDQVGDPRLRENRRARGLPLLRQRQGRPRHRGRGPRAPLPRDRLHGRLRDRPPARHPRRGPARQPRRHRLRRLVQRPPRLRRRRVRPLLRAGGGDRQRQRGDGRRPDAGPDRPRAAPDRHRRPRDRAARREEDPRDRRPRPPRAGPGRLHQPRDQGAGRDGGRRRRSSTRPRSSSTRRAPPTSSPTRPTRRPGSTSRPCASSPSARPEGKTQRIVLRFLASPVEIKGDGKVEIDRRSAATSWSRRTARCAPRTPASAKSSSAAWSCARSATPGSRSRASPSTRSAA